MTESLVTGQRLEHDASRENRHDEIEDNARKEGVSEGIDGTGGSRREHEEEGIKELAPQSGGRSEYAHEDNGNDDVGDVAVNDSGDRIGVAGIYRAVDGLALVKLFFRLRPRKSLTLFSDC